MRLRSSSPILAFFVFLLVVSAAPLAFSQVTASVSGLIQDPSGAAVAAAAVTVNNVNTGLSRATTTDANGHYGVFDLPVGEYEIHATKEGFEQEIRTGIRLAVGQDATVDLSLRVGEVSQQVTVDADAPPVSLTTTDISGLVGEREIEDLPLNGRSYDELLTLNPGVVNFTSQKTGGIGVSNSTVGNNFAVSGNRPQQNLFLLNGVEFTGAAENNMQPGGTSQLLLGVDAVREFNVLRDSYGAEYGKRPGAQVSIITQSGTNQLHGSVYEFIRNSAFDAPNYFDQSSVPPYQRNQFGAALGGPIQKNKTFLFGNYEGFRQNLHQTSAAFVPDLASRASAVPSVQPLLALWPTPAANAPDFNGIAQVFSSPLQTIRDDFGTARLDRIFSGKDSSSAVYTIDDSDDFTATTADPYSTDVESLREQVLSLDETHIFSPQLLNTARVGFSRASYYFTGEPTPGSPAASVPGFLSGHPVGAVVVGGSAASNPQASIGLAGSNNGSNLSVHRNLFTYDDHVDLTRGRHRLNLGVWFQRVQSNEELALSQFGQATFASLATFLQGTTSSFLYTPQPTEMNWRSWLGAWYAEDVIRVTPALTVSLGFRDEFTNGWNEAHGRASTYTFTGSVVSANPTVGTGGMISTLPTVGNSVFTVNNAKFLPQPRIGLAWSPSRNKTVVRAAFGMYNDLQDALGYRTDQNAPFNTAYSIANFTVSQFPVSPSAAAPAAAKIVPGGVQPNLKTPTLISYSVRIEQQLAKDTTLTLGYVGSHGYHEILGIDANTPAPVICPSAPCSATYPTAPPAAITAGFPAGSPLAGAPVPKGSFYIPTTTRANSALANTWTWFSEADSFYNSLQLDVNHRFSEGLSLRGVYTWSKALDDGDSLNSTTSGGEPALASNPYNLRADWGPANFDVRNVSVIAGTYALPIGYGKRYWGSLHGVANTAASGWTVDSIVTLQSGFPLTPQLSYNPSNNGDTRNPVRPFLNPAFHGNAVLGKPSQWFNTNAFIAPPSASGFYGNVARDSYSGPGLATWDFSALKDTTIHERLSLQFRAELFNILNRANFNTPNLILFTPPTAANPSGLSGTAGVINSTATTSRQVQFALKLLW